MLQLHRLVIRRLGSSVSRTRYSTSTIPKPEDAKDKKSEDEMNKKTAEKPIKSTYNISGFIMWSVL